MELLNKNISQFIPQQVKLVTQPQPEVMCELCGGNHPFANCPHSSGPQEEAQFVNNQQRNGNFSNQPFNTNFSNNYVQGWKNNQGQDGWTQDAGPSNSQPQFTPLSEHIFQLEDALVKFMQASLKNNVNLEVSQNNLEVS